MSKFIHGTAVLFPDMVQVGGVCVWVGGLMGVIDGAGRAFVVSWMVPGYLVSGIVSGRASGYLVSGRASDVSLTSGTGISPRRYSAPLGVLPGVHTPVAHPRAACLPRR
jgi:hypothetical protein